MRYLSPEGVFFIQPPIKYLSTASKGLLKNNLIKRKSANFFFQHWSLIRWASLKVEITSIIYLITFNFPTRYIPLTYIGKRIWHKDKRVFSNLKCFASSLINLKQQFYNFAERVHDNFLHICKQLKAFIHKICRYNVVRL